jgi:hypothetical protein
MISYPAGILTRNQARRLIEGKEPMIVYKSYDNNITWHLMGALSPIIGVQEGVTVSRDSLKGLTPNWRLLDQAGANQDGVTFNDAVYEPAEIDMVVDVHGNTPQATRRVIRDWIASWDAHQTGELSVFTFDTGLWWAPVRWLKAPGDTLMRAQSNRQRFVWSARIDDAFWRTYDSVATYNFRYDDLTVLFSSAISSGLGTNWPLKYVGSGTGVAYVTTNLEAGWKDQTGSNTPTREVVAGPYKNFVTGTDNQVISTQLGTMPDITYQVAAYNDLWGRMGKNSDGTWNGYGIRARIGQTSVELSAWNNNVKTVLTTATLASPPQIFERWRLVCGNQGDSRLFSVYRNNAKVLTFKDDKNVSVLGSAYRGVGFGLLAGGAATLQATPANIRYITAGVNQSTDQGANFLPLTNIGDVEAWPRFLLYGPGTFSLGNGPNNTDTVTFGPLLDGQVVLIETEPRRRTVVDVTPAALPSQNLTPAQLFVKTLVTFATNNNTVPFLEAFKSLFGILPPQAALYSLLSGRFTNPIPAKVPGEAPSASYISVQITGGNSSSKVVAAITPRRRWPM